MKNKLIEIGVCSNSISKNIYARNLIKKKFKYYKLNPKKKLKGKELINFLKNCRTAIIGTETLDKFVLDNLPNLKVIGKYGVGLDKIDTKYIKKKKIFFNDFQGFNKRSVSELTLGLIISCLRNLNFINHTAKYNKKWLSLPGKQLTGKTIGIIGCGRIGKDLIKLLKPFNLRILINDLTYNQYFLKKYNLKKSSKNQIYKKSDIVTLHIPMNKSNNNLINKFSFKNMNREIALINTSRGGLVNENDLFKFLKKNKKASSYFDVMEKEPPITNHRLFELKNFFISSHIGGSTQESIELGAKLCINAILKAK